MNDTLKEYAQISKNLITRANATVNIKEKADLKRYVYNKELTKNFSEVDEEKVIATATQLRDLLSRTIRPAVNIFCSVIENEAAMGSRVLTELSRDEYRLASEDLLNFYIEVAREVRREVIPILEEEAIHLNQLCQSLSLRELKSYLSLYEKEKRKFEEIYQKAEFKLNRYFTAFNAFRKVTKSINSFKGKNPKTILCFEIAMSVLCTISGFSLTFTIAKKSLRMVLFGSGTLTKTQLAYNTIDWATEFLNTVNLA